MNLDFSNTNILVIGDVMLDKYFFGKVKRISPEAPVPVVNVTKEVSTLGGASNVANNIVSLGGNVCLCGAIGEDTHGKELQKIAEEKNIITNFIRTIYPTITKSRIIGERQQIVRLDFEDKISLDNKTEEEYFSNLIPLIDKADLVVVSDYAKGFISNNLCTKIITYCCDIDKKVIIDPKGKDWNKYKGAWIITPNVNELADISEEEISNTDFDINKSAKTILHKYNLEQLLVTRSEKGMSLCSTENSIHIPTHSEEVFDVSGAGDTVVATLSLAIAQGINIKEAIHIANVASGVVIKKMGTASLSIGELKEALK
jgi:D-beta-D-heptose 7-phosphate kinase/D-beta-D-heptose 1-phosphate adenosyltransferase